VRPRGIGGGTDRVRPRGRGGVLTERALARGNLLSMHQDDITIINHLHTEL
jgi:hypothetical protein